MINADPDPPTATDLARAIDAARYLLERHERFTARHIPVPVGPETLRILVAAADVLLGQQPAPVPVSAPPDALDGWREPEAVVPAWVCHDGHGRRFRLVEPERTHDGRPLDQHSPSCRLLRVSDSAGNPLPAESAQEPSDPPSGVIAHPEPAEAPVPSLAANPGAVA